MSNSVQYPKPDRSKVPRCFDKQSRDDQLDLGWAESVFRDGRPYRKEFWAQDQLSLLTVFFSSAGLEDLDDNQLSQLLVGEGLIQFTSEERFSAGLPIVDDSGNDMWSVNIVVGAEDTIYVKDRQDMSPYEA